MKHLFMLLFLMGMIVWPSYAQTPPPQTNPAQVVIDLNAPGTPVNPLLFGSNIQWIDNGDGLLLPDSLEFNPDALAMAQGLAPTVLRYPGGSLADPFDWRLGMGSLAERGSIDGQRVTLGLVEFLQLCKAIGAEPLYTVNVVTSRPEDMVALMTAINGLPEDLPRIHYWEIGNEPYLQNEQDPTLYLTPEEYSARANAFIHAMKEADPTAWVGIPLRSDTIGSFPATPYPGYNRTVMESITEPFDFVALHDAYMPIIVTLPIDDTSLFTATMAGTRSTAADLTVTRDLLARYGHAGTPIAMTEYNALYSIGVEPLDSTITSLAGALFVADVLHLLAQQDDLLMANFWSLSGNWYFGAISYQTQPRPAYTVLQVYREKLSGSLLPVTVNSGTFSNPEVGAVPAYDDTPTISALAAVDGGVLRVFVINKSLEAQRVELSGLEGGAAVASGTRMVLTADHPFAGRVPFTESSPLSWQESALESSQLPLTVELPPYSVTVIEWTSAE